MQDQICLDIVSFFMVGRRERTEFFGAGSTLTPGGGSAWASGTEGLDTVYDGASMRSTTSSLYGTTKGPYATRRTYGATFNTVAPRPWQEKMSRHTLKLGPGDFEQHASSHLLSSSSTGWISRGRTGPMGVAFEAERQSLPFRLTKPRTTNTTTMYPKPRDKIIKEDTFTLNFDARHESAMRRDFATTLHSRTLLPPINPAQR
jgi:hypothetical protein